MKRVGNRAHEYRVSFPWIFHFTSREFIQDFGGYFYCSNEFSLYFLDCTFGANNQDVVSTMSNGFLQHQEEMVHKMSGEGFRMVWRILHINSTFTLLCFIWAKKSREHQTQKLMYIKLPMYLVFHMAFGLNDSDAGKSTTRAIEMGGPRKSRRFSFVVISGPKKVSIFSAHPFQWPL